MTNGFGESFKKCRLCIVVGELVGDEHEGFNEGDVLHFVKSAKLKLFDDGRPQMIKDRDKSFGISVTDFDEEAATVTSQKFDFVWHVGRKCRSSVCDARATLRTECDAFEDPVQRRHQGSGSHGHHHKE